MIRKKQNEHAEIEAKLGVILPFVNEANLIAKELKRDIKFTTKLVRVLPDHKGSDDGMSLADLGSTDIVIRIDNFEEGYYY